MSRPLTSLLLAAAVACGGAISSAQQSAGSRSQQPQAQTPDQNLQQSKSKRSAAQSKSADNRKGREKKNRPRSSKSSALTPGREAAALTFARLHHPELAELLSTLKEKRRNQYDRALRHLFQSSERLARLRERSAERYEFSLEAWKLDSRIRLLAAQMTMNEDSQLDEELTRLVKRRADLRLRELKLERDRLVGRLKRVDGLIEKFSSDPEAATRRELQRIKRSFVAKTRRKKKPAERPVTAPTPRRSKSKPDGI